MDLEDKIENQETSNSELLVHDTTKENEVDEIRKKNEFDYSSQNGKNLNGNRNLESGYRNKRKITEKIDKNNTTYNVIEFKSKHNHDLMAVAMEAFSAKVRNAFRTYNDFY